MAVETDLAVDPRYEVDPSSRFIRRTLIGFLSALRSGDETSAFGMENLSRALDAFHAYSIESVGLGGAKAAEFTMTFTPLGLTATEMLVEIARQVDHKTGGAIVAEFRRRQKRHERMMRNLALEVEGRLSSGENWRVRIT